MKKEKSTYSRFSREKRVSLHPLTMYFNFRTK